MEGPSAHIPRPKDELQSERPSPLPKKHRPGLRVALLAAVASISPLISAPPAKAAPASKDRDAYRQSIPKEAVDMLRERDEIFLARNRGERATKLEKKRPNLVMQMDDIDYAARKQMAERATEVANEVGRYLDNERQLSGAWYGMRDSLAKGATEYRGLGSAEDTEAYELLIGILKMVNQVHASYPTAEDLTRSFVQNPDVQTAGRIKDLNERMHEFFALPKEVQNRVLAETVREINARDAETTPAYVPPLII